MRSGRWTSAGLPRIDWVDEALHVAWDGWLPYVIPRRRTRSRRCDSATSGARLLRSVRLEADARTVLVAETWRLPGGDTVTAGRRRLRQCREGRGW